MTKKNQDRAQGANPVWRFFRSVRLTLVLLIILAVVSIFGTLIPQQDGAMEFARELPPWAANFLNSLQLFDLYHSSWFRLLIGLLSLNLIVCSLDRLPSTLKRFRLLPKPDRSGPFENLAPDGRVSLNGDPEEISARVAGLLKGRYRRTQEKVTPEGRFLYAEKGRYSHFGVYLVHLSVLLILAGGIVGSFFGFEAYMAIPEGEAADQVTLRKSRTSRQLPFTVACDKFTVEFYDSGAPKEFRSDLKFFRGDRLVHEDKLLVNHPITFEGITFYQSNYGNLPGRKAFLTITREEGDPKGYPFEAQKGLSLPLPGGEGQFRVVDIHGNLRGMMGPAVLISVKPHQGEERRFWVFRDLETLKGRFPPGMLDSPKLNPSAFKPYTFSLDKIDTRYYTGMQVNRDPGVPLVWAGFFLIVIGLFVTFFMSHRRVWIRITDRKGKVYIDVACRADKNPVGAEREEAQLIRKIGGEIG